MLHGDHIEDIDVQYPHVQIVCVPSESTFLLLYDHNVDKDFEALMYILYANLQISLSCCLVFTIWTRIYHHVQIVCVSSNLPFVLPGNHNVDKDI